MNESVQGIRKKSPGPCEKIVYMDALVPFSHLSPAKPKSSQPEDNSSLILLNYLKSLHCINTMGSSLQTAAFR